MVRSRHAIGRHARSQLWRLCPLAVCVVLRCPPMYSNRRQPRRAARCLSVPCPCPWPQPSRRRCVRGCGVLQPSRGRGHVATAAAVMPSCSEHVSDLGPPQWLTLGRHNGAMGIAALAPCASCVVGEQPLLGVVVERHVDGLPGDVTTPNTQQMAGRRGIARASPHVWRARACVWGEGGTCAATSSQIQRQCPLRCFGIRSCPLTTFGSVLR